MNMKCDLCNKPAVVHEVTVKNGVKKEIHLCEDHAAESGVSMPGQQPINQLLTQFVISENEKPAKHDKPGKAEPQQRTAKRKCPECGLKFDHFRKQGVLGCPTCYETFEKVLAPLIERAQNGATHHVGKAPLRAGVSLDRQRERQRLVKELDEAVNAEQYERAAQIRDTLQSLEQGDSDSDASESLQAGGDPPKN